MSYVNLDRELNISNEQEKDIGFDELLTSYLKYVKNDTIHVPIKQIDSIDVKKIFNEFNSFNDEHNQFSNNNNPNNSLRFISKTNCKITLDEIHSKISEIDDLFSKIDFSKALHYASYPISVIELLKIYKKILTAASEANIIGLQQDKVNIDELSENCKEAINLNSKLTNVDDIKIPDNINSEILCDIDYKYYLYDIEKIENCKNDISRAKQKADEIINLSQELAEFNIKDAMFYVIKIYRQKSFVMLNDKYSHLKTFNAEKLINTIDNIKKWNEKNFVYERCLNVFSTLAIKKWDEKNCVCKFVYKLFHKMPIKNALNEINTKFNKRLETNRRLIQEELPLLE